MHKIFIDGQSGTTGLRIHEYLAARDDLTLLQIPEADRKNDEAKYEFIRQADVVILCLPDDAARQTVKLAANSGTRILDASTAHRIHPDWAYGMPELADGQRDRIKNSHRVANPGCYPTGFLLALAPLVSGGMLPSSAPVTISAISGYTGGGRRMVEEYEAREASHPDELWYARPYGLDMQHKHVPEMKHFAGLDAAPMFMPYVCHYPQGMLVSTPLMASWLSRDNSPDGVYRFLEARYRDEPCVVVHAPNDPAELDQGKLDPQANNGTNRVDIFVFGNAEQILLVARLDNLGKGAAGAAVQNLNLMLGEEELHGLSV